MTPEETRKALGAETPIPISSVQQGEEIFRARHNDVPRRARIDLMIPGELAIREAIRVVEEAGCHPQLTDVVVALGDAQKKLADWYDSGATGATK